MRKSIITNTDSYKFSHYLQYPPGAKFVTSYVEARGIATALGLPATTQIVHFGLQYFIKEYLLKPFVGADIAKAKKIVERHIPGLAFNEKDWQLILDEYNGLLPLDIRALPEGTVVKPGVPQVVVRNTDERFPWLTSYVETAVLRAIWYPSTVATLSREIKKLIRSRFLITDSKEVVEAQLSFKLQDFGARGVSSFESAGIGGAAHLINFMGTDTFSALEFIEDYYETETMPGYSVPASEHSTITSWGENNEYDAFKNMIIQFSKPGSIYACVSDSYNIYEACETIWGEKLRDLVESSGGTLVVRPDSGEPRRVVMQVLKILGEKFGYTTNERGFKVLNTVRVIQGDGVNFQSIGEIMDDMITEYWSIQNITFGMGVPLLQKVDRDSFKYAMKANSINISGVEYDVFKDPIDDKGKTSKRGLFDVVLENGDLVCKPVQNFQFNELKVVYKLDKENGLITNFTTWEKILEKAKISA